MNRNSNYYHPYNDRTKNNRINENSRGDTNAPSSSNGNYNRPRYTNDHHRGGNNSNGRGGREYHSEHGYRNNSNNSGGRYYEQLSTNRGNREIQSSRPSENGGGSASSSKQVYIADSRIPQHQQQGSRHGGGLTRGNSTIHSHTHHGQQNQPTTKTEICDTCRKYDQTGMMVCMSCEIHRHYICDSGKCPKSKEIPNQKRKFMCEQCFDIKVKIEGDDFQIQAMSKESTRPIYKNEWLEKMNDYESSSVPCPLCSNLIAGHSREIFYNHLRFGFKNALIERNLLVGTVPIPIISRTSGSIEHSFKINDFNALSCSFFVLGFTKEELDKYMNENLKLEREAMRNFTQLKDDMICFVSCTDVRGAFMLACKLRCAVISQAHPMIYFIKSVSSLKIFKKISSTEEFAAVNNSKNTKNMTITSVVPNAEKNEAIAHFENEFDCIKWLWECHKSSTDKKIAKIQFHNDHEEWLDVCRVENLPTGETTIHKIWQEIKHKFKSGLSPNRKKLEYYVSEWSYDSDSHTIKVEFHHPKFCELFKCLVDDSQVGEVKISVVIPNKY